MWSLSWQQKTVISYCRINNKIAWLAWTTYIIHINFFYNASIQSNVVSHIISHLVVLISNDKLWTKFYLKRKQCNWAESKFSCVFVPYLIYKFTTLVTQDALWWPVGIEEVNDSSTDIPCSFALSLSIRIHHWTLLYICTSNICHDRYIYCNPHIKHTSKGSKEAR